MADAVRVNTEEMAQVAPTLRAGQRVLLSGVCYTCLLYTSPSPRD